MQIFRDASQSILFQLPDLLSQHSTLNDTDHQQHTAARAQCNHQPRECLRFNFLAPLRTGSNHNRFLDSGFNLHNH